MDLLGNIVDVPCWMVSGHRMQGHDRLGLGRAAFTQIDAQHRSHRTKGRRRDRGQLGPHGRKDKGGGTGSDCRSKNEWREIVGPAGLI